MKVTPELLDKASQVFKENHPMTANFAKCCFLSYYCTINDCNFCYRSTIKKKEDPSKMRRTLGSIFVEAFLSKQLGYELEFMTGGYGIYPIDELVEISKVLSTIYEQKIWINLGAMSKPVLQKFKPYVQGVVASIETINPELRKIVCPSKPLSGYNQLFKNADGFEKSCAFIVGLGEKDSDLDLLHEYIRRHNLSRITFYALKPVKGTPYTKGPDSDYYAAWIAKTRVAFPKLKIIAGITVKRAADTELLLKAGANLITMFPIFRYFNSAAAQVFEKGLKTAGRTSHANMTTLPNIDFNAKIDSLDIDEAHKIQMKQVLPRYLEKLSRKQLLKIRL